VNLVLEKPQLFKVLPNELFGAMYLKD